MPNLYNYIYLQYEALTSECSVMPWIMQLLNKNIVFKNNSEAVLEDES